MTATAGFLVVPPLDLTPGTLLVAVGPGASGKSTYAVTTAAVDVVVEQPPADGANAWHYTADVVAVDPDGRVLLIERRWEPFTGCWALPGGHLDEGEDSRHAAARELAEEAGVRVDAADLTLIGTYDAPGRDPRGRYSTDAYLARVPADTVAVADDDAANVRWVELSSAEEDGTLAFDHADILRVAGRMLTGGDAGGGHLTPLT
ncbi:NUDIX hydrolase [Streptomyces ortus]|uniref:NUDIX hydrolase n=1 Tax=Streptomyces ortus TaxID=2867268 RepID=UPI00249E5539|nr:NUDIX hydrolase [Streptomyces ortus]